MVHWQNNNKHDIIYVRLPYIHGIQCTVHMREAVVTWLHDFILNIFLVVFIFFLVHFVSLHFRSVGRSDDLTSNLKCHARTVYWQIEEKCVKQNTNKKEEEEVETRDDKPCLYVL